MVYWISISNFEFSNSLSKLELISNFQFSIFNFVFPLLKIEIDIQTTFTTPVLSLQLSRDHSVSRHKGRGRSMDDIGPSDYLRNIAHPVLMQITFRRKCMPACMFMCEWEDACENM